MKFIRAHALDGEAQASEWAKQHHRLEIIHNEIGKQIHQARVVMDQMVLPCTVVGTTFATIKKHVDDMNPPSESGLVKAVLPSLFFVAVLIASCLSIGAGVRQTFDPVPVPAKTRLIPEDITAAWFVPADR